MTKHFSLVARQAWMAAISLPAPLTHAPSWTAQLVSQETAVFCGRQFWIQLPDWLKQALFVAALFVGAAMGEVPPLALTGFADKHVAAELRQTAKHSAIPGAVTFESMLAKAKVSTLLFSESNLELKVSNFEPSVDIWFFKSVIDCDIWFSVPEKSPVALSVAYTTAGAAMSMIKLAKTTPSPASSTQ
ncbi:MAG: hypothetical protein WC551_03515 [Patescibacteria group bacterium]